MSTATGAPIWLLDIDGVINAVQAEPEPGYRAINTTYGPVRVRTELVAQIAALYESDAVDLRWLTTWMARSHDLARWCGLPDALPVEGGEQFFKSRPDEWWKAEAARAVSDANPDRLIIWTDDDLDYSYGCGELDWVIGRPMLRISPDPQVGLTDEHMDAIEAACGRAPTSVGASVSLPVGQRPGVTAGLGLVPPTVPNPVQEGAE